MTVAPPRLVLLGGGHAHLHVLKDLARWPALGAASVLVSPNATLSYSGMVPGVVAGHYVPADCTIPLAQCAAAAGVRHVRGSAVGIDAAARRVHLADGRTLPYEVLSLDIGGQQDAGQLPGAAEHALFVRPLGAFVQHLAARLRAAAPGGLGWVVIGGGAAGFELALALRQRGLGVSLVTGGGAPLAGYPSAVMRRGALVLAAAGVQVLRARAVAVGPATVEIEGRGTCPAQACLIATGTTAPPWLAGSGLALDASGFVRIGATLQSVSHPEVLAAGDVATRVDVAQPRSGVHAVRAGPPLGRNLRLLLQGRPPEPYQPPQRTLNLLSCGNGRAIAVWGGWSAEGRWAWRWKDHIDRAFVAHHGGPAEPDRLIREA